MTEKDKDYLGSERRRYIRLDSVYPVQFRLVSPDASLILSDWQQGFTNNLCKEGMCLSVNKINPELAASIKNKQAKLSLEIEIPLFGKYIPALAAVAWAKDSSEEPGKFLIGLNYEKIDKRHSARIIGYARFKKLFFPVAIAIIIVLGIGFAVDSLINVSLIKGNKMLVDQLVKVLQESSVAEEKLEQINKEKEDLQVDFQALQLRIKAAEQERANFEAKVKSEEEKAKKEEDGHSKKINELNTLITKLAQEKGSFQEKLSALQNRENTVTEELLSIDKRKSILEEKNFAKMYQWLKVHQNPRTGLVMSFEGDGDIANWAFVYDQALLIQAYSLFADFGRAKEILEFFDKKAKKVDGLFLNAYYATDGEPAEYIVHCGPNIWLGIAALQYAKESADSAYIGLTEEIALGIVGLQNQDKEGGIRGGPSVSWYATEHNLDAYAFFNMLYQITGKKFYAQARDKVLAWLTSHTYDKCDVPIIRGKGDSTIATDTYAWSIAAVGPEKLNSIGMNPDKIMEFAEQNCSAEVSFVRPEGKTVKVKGFDFAPQRHVARGGVVSSEWTSQMIMSFKIMADYYYKKGVTAKAKAYLQKAEEYLLELSNMIISSPSPSGQGEGCLPYATHDFVDTGHGWMTPKGKSTGSVAGTVYALFAYYNYNPLKLKE